MKELDALNKMNLARGASLENTLAIRRRPRRNRRSCVFG